MKLLKYAVLALVIMAACKRTTPQSKSSLAKEKRKKVSSNIDKYDDDKKIAKAAKTTFVSVYEYDPKVNHIAPNKVVPAMIPFGTIHPKISNSSDRFISKYKDTISLYGIPVEGYRKPIRKAHTHKAIGFFWKDQDQVKGSEYGLGIAQMHSGDTYVGVKPVHMPNYIEKFHDPSYSPDELELLKERYGVKANIPVLIGTSVIGTTRYSGPYRRQKYVIYGIKLPDIQEANDSFAMNQQLIHSKKLISYPMVVYKAIQKYLESKKNGSLTSSLNSDQGITHRDAALFIYTH